jgi:hypothetical protein
VNVTIFVYDIASNVNSSANRNWTIDSTTPASIDFVNPTLPHGTNTTLDYLDINVTFTETNVDSCIVQIENASATNFTMTLNNTNSSFLWCFFNASQASNDGPWNFTVYVNDTAGNLNVSATRSVTVDTAAPGLSSWTYSVVTKNVTLTFNESVEENTLDLSKINITSQDGSTVVQLAGVVNATTYTYSVNLTTINITLTSDQYSSVEAISDTPLQLDMAAGAVTDLVGLNVVANTSLNITTYSQFTIVIPSSGFWGTAIWNSFNLPTQVLDMATSLGSNYSVDNVLDSVRGNYEMIYYYNSSSWQSYIPGRATNDFTTFTANDDTHRYWINVTTTDRLEIV